MINCIDFVELVGMHVNFLMIYRSRRFVKYLLPVVSLNTFKINCDCFNFPLARL